MALAQDSLIVYKCKGRKHAKRAISLSDRSKVEVCPVAMDTSKRHSFCIESDGVKHFLAAASVEEKEMWLMAIKHRAVGSRHSSRYGGSTVSDSRLMSSTSSIHSIDVDTSGGSYIDSIISKKAKDAGIEMLVDVERMLSAGEAPVAEAAVAIARVLECGEEPSMRSRAAKALGVLASSSPVIAAAALPFALVTEREPDVRAAVAIAIGAAGKAAMGSSGRCALERATAADKSMKVRSAAEQALSMAGWLEVAR